MSELATESYEDEPYASLTHARTHPDVMATIGLLLGMDPAPVERCRVLELGCGPGANIISMAETLPGSEFVGVDLSARQVAEGRGVADELGFDNVRFEQGDILALDPALGQFDYIIAHGIYSWVPPAVRDGLLQVCRERLNPHGIGYISYGTYPGSHHTQAIREMMLYHVRELTDPGERAARAREFMALLSDVVPATGGPLGYVIQSYSEHVKDRVTLGGERADSLLLHDELAAINDPCYVHEFINHAERYHLRYLADADFTSSMMLNKLPKEAAQRVLALATSLAELEQYQDFMVNRGFRHTLLCHDEVEVQRHIRPTPELFARFHVRSLAVPEHEAGPPAGETVERFQAGDGAQIAIDHPVTCAAMRCLWEIAPATVPFNELLTEGRRRVALGGALALTWEEDAQVLATNLLRGFVYSANLVGLHARPSTFATKPGDRPVAGRFARLLATQGSLVTNLWHDRIELDPFVVGLLPFLDGTRTRGDLVDDLLHRLQSGELELQPRLDAEGDLRTRMEKLLDEALDTAAYACLLLA
jgi:SAM-dependent methyltransferase